MPADTADAHAELSGDLFVGQTFHSEQEDLPAARRQLDWSANPARIKHLGQIKRGCDAENSSDSDDVLAQTAHGYRQRFGNYF